jgi:hypothetical protein
MCHWPECHYDYVIVPNMNMTLMIRPNCEKNVKKFKLFLLTKLLKIQLLPHLGFKVTKSPPRNPKHQGVSSNTKRLPQFPDKIVFDLIEFSMTKLFNNSSMLSLKITKPPQYTFTLQKISNSRYFQWHQEHSKGCYGLGQTKQTTLLNI